MRRRSVAVAVAAGVLVIAVGVTAGVVATSIPSNKADTPRPAGSRVLFATLDALSCPSAGDCTAVGHELAIDKDAAAADPDEGRGGDTLSGVSCPTTNECVAVGNFRPEPFGAQATAAAAVYPLIEELRRGSWAIVPGPQAPPDTSLVALACPSTTSCTAVGSTTTGAGSAKALQSPFVETFDGSAWSVVTPPGPADASTELKSVSCPAVSSCVVVGDTAPASDPTATRPFVWQLADGSWRASAPTPASMGGTLDDVTCHPASRCVAVGNAVTGPSAGSALMVSLGATGWEVDPTALEQSGDIALASVDCPADGDCVVAGIALASATRVLARVDAGGWHPLAGYGQDETVQALACPSWSACTVVGSSYVNGYGNTTALVASLLGDTLRVGRAPV